MTERPGDEGAPDREQNGGFKKGHVKRGGRKKGTPNLISSDFRKAMFRAAYETGSDGEGKDGFVGYFVWLGLEHPDAYLRLWGKLAVLQRYDPPVPDEPPPTIEEINAKVRAYIGLNRRRQRRGRGGSNDACNS